MLNEDGEFLNDAEGKGILALAEANEFIFSKVEDLGAITLADYSDYHIRKVLELKLVDVDAIRKAKFVWPSMPSIQ